MPREADQLFLKLAVRKGLLAKDQADRVWVELEERTRRGHEGKARAVCLEQGLLTAEHARRLKHEVRSRLQARLTPPAQEAITTTTRAQRRIAGYEVLGRLGCGAMGVVFRAREPESGRPVALKVLNPEYASDPTYVARFEQEANLAASLSHPNVVQAYGAGRSGHVHYLAMELVEGKTVKDLIERRGALDEVAALEITLQVLDALEHAHTRNLVHRDVKPANLMITPAGQTKLLDLGLARRTDVDCGLTGDGRAIGTPYFMSPEQALDKGTDYRSDLYSLGVTLFNMVTGRKPFEGHSPVAVMNQHLKAPVPDASQVNSAVSAGTAQVIQRLMAKRPAERYQDHAALRADLEAVLAGQTPRLEPGRPPAGVEFIAPRPAAVDEEATATARPWRRLGWALASAAGVLVGVGLTVALGRAATPTGTVAVAARDGGPEARELAARRRLEQAPGAGLARAEALQALAREFSDTPTGQEASREAGRLEAELSLGEERRYASRAAELDAWIAQGRLLAAQEGYQALSGSLRDDALARQALTRSEALQAQLHERVGQLQEEALALRQQGREPEAAARLRACLELVPAAEQAELLAALDHLERAGAARAARIEAVAAELPPADAEDPELHGLRAAGR